MNAIGIYRVAHNLANVIRFYWKYCWNSSASMRYLNISEEKIINDIFLDLGNLFFCYTFCRNSYDARKQEDWHFHCELLRDLFAAFFLFVRSKTLQIAYLSSSQFCGNSIFIHLIMTWKDMFTQYGNEQKFVFLLQRRNLWFIWNVFLREIGFCKLKWNFTWNVELLLIHCNVFLERKTFNVKHIKQENLLSLWFMLMLFRSQFSFIVT